LYNIQKLVTSHPRIWRERGGKEEEEEEEEEYSYERSEVLI
jgi:hypothetical protein